MREIRYIFSIVFFIIIYLQSFSQSLRFEKFSLKENSQYNIYKYNVDKGLPTPRINRILQDENGFIWMTSYDGIIRFDSHNFDLYDSYNEKGLTGNSFYAICEDNNTIWISSSQDGLVAYKDHKFYSYGPEVGINMLYEVVFADSKNLIWSGISGRGCFYFENGKFVFPFDNEEFNSTEVVSIEESEDGSMFFGSYGKGLYKYFDKELIQFGPKDGLNSQIITALHQKEDILYIGSDNGIFIYDGINFKHIEETADITVYKIFENKEGEIFFTTGNGLFQIQKDKGSNYLDIVQLLDDKFYDGIFDLDGTIWLTHYDSGVLSIRKSNFINVTEEHGLSGNVVNAICELEDGRILVGYDNGKLNIIDNFTTSDFGTNLGLENSRIRHILQDSRKNIWISTYNGLLKLDPAGKKKWFNNSTGFPSTKIRLCYEDTKKDIWVGTRDKGLLKLTNGEKLEENALDFDFEAGSIMSIEEAGNQFIVGTAGKGLVIFSKEKAIHIYDIENKLLSNVVFNTYTDKDGTIWVACNGGICRIKDDEIFHFTEENGFMVHSPFDIVEDNFGMLWIPFNRGIVSVNKQEMNDFADGFKKEIQYNVYDKEEGIRNEGMNATTQTLLNKDGKLFFPAKYGFATVDPAGLSVKKTIPPVYIEEFSYNGKKLDLNNSIEIVEGKFRYDFKFTAINFFSPEKIKFRYMLNGFDDDWIYSNSNVREISYTHLPPGNYEFVVTASNKTGIWNEKGANIRFKVVPKWYNTLMVRVIIGLILIFLIYSIYRFRVNRLKRNEKILEDKVKERTNELTSALELVNNQKDEIETQKEELHHVNQMKDKLFSIIAHDLKAPFGSVLSLIQSIRGNMSNYDNEQTEYFIELIYKAVESGFNLLENLLEWAKFQLGKTIFTPKIFDIKPYIEDNINLLRQNAENKSIALIYDIDEDVTVFADENMFNTIIRNLISNAIKYSHKGEKIEIYAKEINDKVNISITDYGVGIKPENINKIIDSNSNFSTYGTENEKGTGLGISLINEFVVLNGGKLSIESKEGKGSRFSVTFLIKPLK